jgi:hypothetical protein
MMNGRNLTTTWIDLKVRIDTRRKIPNADVGVYLFPRAGDA